MFCMRCGQEVPAAAESCPACGQSTKLPEPSAPQAQDYGVIPPPPRTGYPPLGVAPGSLKGVGGALLVFCIFLTMVWPLWTLSQFVIRHGMLRLLNSLGLLRMAFGMVVGLLLWTESRAAIMLLRIYFIIAVLLTAWSVLSFTIFSMRYSGGFMSSAFVTGWLASALPYILFLVLGIVYFTRSERVRATYGENLL